MSPCPLCGAATSVDTIEMHLALAHPEHHVHLFGPIPLCEHQSFTAALFHGPSDGLPGFATPLMVN